MPLCYNTPFHILTDPEEFTGDTTYGPGWAVSDNTMLLDEGRKLGDDSCTTCTEKAGIAKGLRAEVMGTVVTVDPPVLEITSVKYLMDGDMGCKDMAMGGENITTPEDSTPITTDGTTTEPDDTTTEPDDTTTEPDTSAAVQVSAFFAAVAAGLFAVLV